MTLLCTRSDTPCNGLLCPALPRATWRTGLAGDGPAAFVYTFQVTCWDARLAFFMRPLWFTNHILRGLFTSLLRTCALPARQASAAVPLFTGVATRHAPEDNCISLPLLTTRCMRFGFAFYILAPPPGLRKRQAPPTAPAHCSPGGAADGGREGHSGWFAACARAGAGCLTTHLHAPDAFASSALPGTDTCDDSCVVWTAHNGRRALGGGRGSGNARRRKRATSPAPCRGCCSRFLSRRRIYSSAHFHSPSS